MKLSEDPNNTTWVNDKSRFGFLMLKKMGWSEGVGLGKNEQGVVEAIKVKKRKEAEEADEKNEEVDKWCNESVFITSEKPALLCEGLGVENPSQYVAWTMHKSAFDSILSKLSSKTYTDFGSDSDPASPISGQVRSREDDDFEDCAEKERKRQKREAKKQVKQELEASYDAMGLTEEEKAVRREAERAQRKAEREEKRQQRRLVSRGE